MLSSPGPCSNTRCVSTRLALCVMQWVSISRLTPRKICASSWALCEHCWALSECTARWCILWHVRYGTQLCVVKQQAVGRETSV